MEYIGFDYHKKYTVATSINKETGEMRQERLANTHESIGNFINDPENTHAVFESSYSWPVLYNILREHVASVKLAHPAKVKAIAAAKIKTDKIDSKILAELLSADLIPEAHIRLDDNRAKQKVLRQRVFFVSMRTRIKNRIHAIINNQPLEVRKDIEGLTDLFGKAGMEWLRNVIELSENDKTLLDQMLALYDILTVVIKQSDKMINKIFDSDEDAQLLESMSGVGKFLAVLLSTEIDGIERFLSAKKLASYTGIIPSTYSSGGHTWHGKITKQGNKWLRWAFIEAAQTAKRYNAQLNSFYTKIYQRTGNKNKAKVALANRMCTIAFRILRDRTPFDIYRKPNTFKKASRVAL